MRTVFRDVVAASLGTLMVLNGEARGEAITLPISYGDYATSFGVTQDFALEGAAAGDIVQFVATTNDAAICLQVFDNGGTPIATGGCALPPVSVKIQLPRAERYTVRLTSIDAQIAIALNISVVRLLPAAFPILDPYAGAVSVTGSIAPGHAATISLRGVEGTVWTVKTERTSGYSHVCTALLDPLGNALASAPACSYFGAQSATVTLPHSGNFVALIYELGWKFGESYKFDVVCSATCTLPAKPLRILNRNPLSTATVGRDYDSGEMVMTGGSVPYGTFEAIGELPAGVTLDPHSGRLRGVVSTPGAWAVDVSVVDDAGVRATEHFLLRAAIHTARFNVISTASSAFQKNETGQCLGTRGFSVAVFDVGSGQLEDCRTYDTWLSDPNLLAFDAYLHAIPEDPAKLVAVACGDECGIYRASQAGAQVLGTMAARFGARKVSDLTWRGSYALLSLSNEHVPLDERIGVFVSGGGWALVQAAFSFPETPTGGIEPTGELILNGAFSSGPTNWMPFAQPDNSFIVSNVTNGVLQFQRTGGTEAAFIHSTGLTISNATALEATFALGNTDTVRKRMKVLVHDLDFSDSASCTFFLDASSPLQTYRMRLHTSKAWTNATISFYASTVGSGGFYQIDDVSLQVVPGGAADQTICTDPTVPAPPGGPDESNLLVNGSFGTGMLAPWNALDALVYQIVGGVLELKRTTSLPAPVVLQTTGQAMVNDQILTATFQIGNSSTTRHRTKILIHDADFSDSASCVFWIPPNTPLQTYTMRVSTTKLWTNATIAFYPSTGATDDWTLVDNVLLQRTPSALTTGTSCLEPGSSSRSIPDETAGQPTHPLGIARATFESAITLREGSAFEHGLHDDTDALVSSADAMWLRTVDGWQARRTLGTPGVAPWPELLDLTDALSARLTFESWLSAVRAHGDVQVSLDAIEWITVAQVDASDTWQPVEVDLAAFLGQILELRFVLDGAPPPAEDPDIWRVRDIHADVVPGHD